LKQVLIVDDDAYTCEIVSRILAREDIETTSVLHGGKGLDLLAHKKFDALILDIVMPDIDGWQVIRKVRSTPATAFLPVIFLSGRGGDENRIQGFRLGADDFMEKPFNKEELRLRVMRILESSSDPMTQTLALDDGFQGNIQDIGLGPLLTLFDMENKTGFLRIDAQNQSCTFYLRAGRIVRASMANSDKVNRRAIYAALSWQNGVFHFRDCEVDGEDFIQENTSQLLLEFAQALDEQNML